MPVNDLIPFLKCPRSHTPLEVKGGQLYSSREDYSYENIGGIPWVFREPDIHLYQWQNHVKRLVIYLQSQSNLIEAELALPELLNTTQQRLMALKEAVIFNAEAILKLLKPLIDGGEVYKPDGHQLALEKLPDTQHLNSYFHTLFRDWAWNTPEHEKYANLVNQSFDKNIENLAVLGSGASRLSLDIHLGLNLKNTLCIDINPILLLAAKEICEGKNLELYEIPLAPLALKDCAIRQNLNFSGTLPKSLHFVFADAINAPLAKNSVDAILTPWFIDIIPQNFASLAQKINFSLAKDGQWVNCGPLSYNSMRARGYSQDEIMELLKAKGFEVEKCSVEQMDYLVSPHSSQWRNEKVLLFRARKVRDLDEPEHFNYLPNWVTDMNTPIPRTETLEQTQVKTQIAYQLLNLINGSRAQNDIIPLMMNSYSMDEEMAKETLVAFLTNFYEGKV